MRKKLTIFILIPIIVSSLFFINTGINITAEECSDSDQIATEPGDSEFPENWNCNCNPYIPMNLNISYNSSYPDTIKCGYDVGLNILDGCAPFEWEITSGQGYTLNKIDDRQYNLSCSGNSCGESEGKYSASVTIKVSDSCGESTETSIRNNGGKWVLVHDQSCGEVEPCGGYTWCDCTRCSSVIVGAYKYEDCWIGGNCSFYSRYTGFGCTKWPDTVDHSSSKCSCAGYMISFNIVGMWSHKKWEWQCK